MKHTRTTQQHTRERFIFFGLAVLLLALFSAYVYFVSESIVHVVMRKELDVRIAELHSEISTLEADYIASQHAMSEDIASLHGYVQATEKIFIDRSDATLVLSTNREP